MLAVPSVPLFVALACGIAVAEAVALPLAACWALALVAAAALLLAARRRRFVALFACACMAGGGALRSRAVQAPPFPVLCGDHATPRAPGSPFRVRIVEAVQRQGTAARRTQQTVAELLYEQCGDSWQPRRGRVPLTLRPGEAVQRGDVLQVRLRLLPILARRNPQEADPLRRGRATGWVGRAQVRSDHALLQPGSGPATLLDEARRTLSETFEARLLPPQAAVAKALVLGDGGGLEIAQRDAWSDAGMAHLLSVSGLHVGIVSALLLILCRGLLRCLPTETWRLAPRRLAALLALPGIVAFCLLTGASAPAVRAATMGGLAALGIAFGMPSSARNAWGVAGIGMLLWAPLALFEAGFLLSFAAVGGLLWGAGGDAPAPVDDMDDMPPPPGRLRRLGAALRAAVQLSCLASLATLPLCAAVFGRVSLVAPVVNLLAVPLGSLVATPLALLAGCWRLGGATAPGLASLLQALQVALQGLETLAQLAGTWRFAALDVAPFAAYGWPLYLGGLWLLQRGRGWQRGAAATLGLGWLGHAAWAAWAPVAPLPLLTAAPPPQAPAGGLTLRHLYIGQGDATLITLPHGRHILVDGGGAVFPDQADPGRAMVIPLLRYLGVKRLELVVLTHPHPDHVGGLVAVTRAYPVGRLWTNGDGENFGPERQVLALGRAAGVAIQRAVDLPETLWLDGVQIDVLHPRPSRGAIYSDYNTNDNSLVLRLQYGRRSVLLAADIEQAAERRLLPQLRGRIDWLKVPHHGSDTSSTLPFLQALQPAAAVISCGDDNVYDFPRPSVLDRYRDLHIPVWRTDLQGLVTFHTDGQAAWTRAER